MASIVDNMQVRSGRQAGFSPFSNMGGSEALKTSTVPEPQQVIITIGRCTLRPMASWSGRCLGVTSRKTRGDRVREAKWMKGGVRA